VLSSVRQLVAGLRHDLFSEYRIAVLKAFLDDSGSGGDSRWIVLAGYVGTVEGWDRFDGRWLAAMNAPPKIEYFKAKEAERRRDQFEGVTEEQRDAKIDALIAVIAQCAERSICARVRQTDYNEIVKGKIPPAWDSPYYFLFSFLIGHVVLTERFQRFGEQIEFVFDSDQRHEEPSLRLATELEPYSSFTGGIARIHYQSDRLLLPLQAADLLAWQIRRAFCVTTEPKRRHFDMARNSLDQPPIDSALTRVDLTDLMSDARERAKRLAESLGIPPDMGTW
jgi:hypothetical protein